jgi:acyl-CoA synthetase (AMP-forming)/AMP-acid ligase II
LGVIAGGSLYILGRKKEIIIVNGKNIHAGDVEDRVGAVAGVRAGRVAAFGLENLRSGSEDLVVIAEKDPAVDTPEAAIRAQINAVVSDAFLVKPHDVRIVTGRWLVKSTSGKVSRDRNRTKYLRDLRPDLL